MTETNGGLKAELNTILPGQNPLANLSVVRTGLNDYVVLSARNGGVTRNKVTLDPAECTCPDWQYNLDDDERNVCAHYALAVIEGQDITTADVGVSEIASLTRESRQLAQDAHAALKGADEANVAARETEAAAVKESTDASRETDGQAAADAAETLQEAFDATVDGMDTQAHNGLVWINKTPDAPDYTFDAFLSGPDLVQYLPPDENDTPGDYWKNALEPADVEEYISEVLE